jgi:hypothetical protein
MLLIHRSPRAANAVQTVSPSGEMFVASVVIFMILASFADAIDPAVFGEAVPPEFSLFDFGGEFSVLGMCHWNLLQFVMAGSLLSGAVFVLRLGGSRAYKVLRSASRRALSKVPI